MGLHLHHCHIQIRNIDESLTFFCEHLGLIERERIYVDSQDLTLLYLGTPDSINQSNKAAVLELAYYHDNRPITDGNRFAHIAFSVDELNSFCQQLARQGVNVLQEPINNQYAYIQSPDGLVVELLQSQEHRIHKQDI